MFSKLQCFVNKGILLLVYYGIFHLDLAYLCLVWGQAKYSTSRISSIFCSPEVLKLIDLISLQKCIFVNKSFNDDAFSLFLSSFKLISSSHSYCTKSVSNGLTFKRRHLKLLSNKISWLQCS